MWCIELYCEVLCLSGQELDCVYWLLQMLVSETTFSYLSLFLGTLLSLGFLRYSLLKSVYVCSSLSCNLQLLSWSPVEVTVS